MTAMAIATEKNKKYRSRKREKIIFFFLKEKTFTAKRKNGKEKNYG